MLVKLYRAREGRKEFAGYLKGYDEATGDVTVTVGSQDLVFPKKGDCPYPAWLVGFTNTVRQDVFYQQGESAT